METFTEWLEVELTRRNWTRADLAKRAGISQTTLSLIYSGSRKPGNEVCNAIARAFDLPQIFVLQKAGLASNDTELSPLAQRLLHDAQGLSDADLEWVISIVETRKEQYRLNPSLKPRPR